MSEPTETNTLPAEKPQADASYQLPIVPLEHSRRFGKKFFVVAIIIVIAALLAFGAYLFSTNAKNGINPIKSLGLNGTTEQSIHLKQSEKHTLASGDMLCLDAAYVYYTYKGNECDYTTLTAIRLQEDRTYVFQRAGQEYTITYDKCDRHKDTGFEGESTVVTTGCTMNVATKNIDNKKLATFTKDITLGAGIYIENNSMYGTAMNTRDPNRVSIPPVLSENPLFEIIQRDFYDKDSNTQNGFQYIWVSKDCANGKVCTLPDAFYSDGSGGRSVNLKLGILTRRGPAVFVFSPDDMYEKKSKSAQLDHAVGTMSVTGLSYDACEYYCEYEDTKANPAKGQIYNRVTFSFSYKEDKY